MILPQFDDPQCQAATCCVREGVHQTRERSPLQTASYRTNKLPARNDALDDALDEQSAARAELKQLRANSSLAPRLDMGL